MSNLAIIPTRLKKKIRIPSSKSHTMRALLFALMARGDSLIHNPLVSPDTLAMRRAIELLGAKVITQGTTWQVRGTGGELQEAKEMIDAGNSGQVLRFIGALAALIPAHTLFTGDVSIRTLRPVKPLLSALSQLGAIAESMKGNDLAPFMIKGPLLGGKATLSGEDSQPVSALLMACSFAPSPTELVVENPGEKSWIDLTLSWLKRCGITVSHSDYTHYSIPGGASIAPFEFHVPGDFSSAAFPIVAALITQSELSIENLDFSDVQGDKKILSILQEMGALFEIQENTLVVKQGEKLKGIAIDVNECIDALPILSVMGCYAEGTTTLFNGAIARKKESDRIRAISTELGKMGALIEETADGLKISSSSLQGAHLFSHDDHRIGLALSVAALGAAFPSSLSSPQCMDKSYPHFLQELCEYDSVRV